MNRKIIAWVWIVWISCIAGCDLMQPQPDGTFAINPERVEQLDRAAAITEDAGQIAAATSVWVPVLGPVAGILLGAAGVWKKMRPQVQTAKDTAELATAAGEATAGAIEQFKEQYPDEWTHLEELFVKYHGQEVENFYRALRGVSPKK